MNIVAVPVPVPGIYPGSYPIFPVFTLHKGRVPVWDVAPVPRVLWHLAYITHARFEYEYDCHT